MESAKLVRQFLIHKKYRFLNFVKSTKFGLQLKTFLTDLTPNGTMFFISGKLIVKDNNNQNLA